MRGFVVADDVTGSFEIGGNYKNVSAVWLEQSIVSISEVNVLRISSATLKEIQEIQENAFVNATNLKQLYISSNPLTALPSQAFDGASGLAQMFFERNRNESTFDGLVNLRMLGLESEGLRTLPLDVFKPFY